MKPEKNFEYIEKGKQLGKIYSFKVSNELVMSSVADQKWDGLYKVYIDEIFESQMASEEYLKEFVETFNTLDEAILFIESNTKLKFEELTPCKGQKIFNPKFEV